MILDKEHIINSFDEIAKKVESLIELNQSLQTQNEQLLSRIEDLEMEVLTKEDIEKDLAEKDSLIQSKFELLFSKLENFTRNNESE